MSEGSSKKTTTDLTDPGPAPAHDEVSGDRGPFRDLTVVLGLLAVFSAVLGLLSIRFNITILSSVYPGYKTIALSAALFWILFGAILSASAIRPLQGIAGWVAKIILAAAVVLEAVELPLNILGTHSAPELWMTGIGAVLVGPSSSPISPAASLLIILAAFPLFFIVPGRGRSRGARWVADFAGISGSVVAIAGFIFVLSYLFGDPLLYGTQFIPIAALSALAAFFIGAGLVSAAGPAAIPLKFFSGTTTQARMLRIFVPLAVVIVLVQQFVFSLALSPSAGHNALLIAGSLVLFAGVTGLVVSRVSATLGSALDTAETVLVRKNEDLGAMNEELTAIEEELRQNFEALQESEERLHRAHELLEAVTSGTNVFIATVDNNLNYTFFNKAYEEEIFRLTRKTVTNGTNILELFESMPEQQRVVFREWGRTLGGETSSTELALGEPGRYRRTYNVLHTPVHDNQGRVIGAGEVAIDITPQVKAEEALRESEERMRFALGISHTGAWDLDLSDHTAHRSLDHDRIFGYAGLLPEWTYEMFLGHILPEDRAPVDAKFRHAVETQGDWNFECRIRRTDGEIRWIQAAGRHRPGGSGSAGRMSGIVQDITDRKLAGEALKESEERFRVIAETTPVLLSVSSIADGTILFTNPAYDRTFGFRPGELIGKSAMDRFHDAAERKVLIDTLRETRELRDREVRATRKDGTSLWLSTSLEWIRFGGTDALLGASVDITERKRAEDELLKSRNELEMRVEERTAELRDAADAVRTERQRLYDVLETLPVYVCLLDKDYRMPFANRYFRETFREPKGRRCHEFLFDRDGPCEDCETYTVMKTRAPHHWYWTGPNGRDYDIYDFPFTDTDGSFMILEMGIDITERTKAEGALRKANAYNRSLIEASLDPLVTISPDGTISDVNEATIRVTGCSREDLVGTDFCDYFVEPARAKEGYETAFNNGLVTDYALEIRHRNGQVTPVLYNATVYRDTAGNVVGVFAGARDITGQKKAEEALRKEHDLLENRVKDRTSELVQSNTQLKEEIAQRRQAETMVKKTVSELHAALESTADGIYVVDRAGRIVRYNQNFTSMWKVPDELLQTGEDHRVTEYLATLVKNPGLFRDRDDGHGHPRDRESYDMLELLDGRIFERYSKPQKMDTAIIGRVMSYRDVTDRRRAEEKLLASLQEKETLIREIHHRVKNNLQIISGLLDMTRMRTTDSTTNGILTDMMMKIKTMAQIHTRLYESKQFDKINMGIQIRDQVNDMSSIYGRSGAEIESEISVQDVYLPVDQAIPCALVVNEILSNAFKHAFKGKKHGNLKVSVTAEDGRVRITVKDDGVGIPRDVDVSRATSLGLKLIRSLVQQLNGSVSINGDKGTEVTVECPFHPGGK